MPPRALSPLFLRSSRPSRALGLLVALAGIAVETLAIYPLAHVANVVSLGVVYLIAVVVVSTYWGIGLGLAHGARERGRVQLLPPAAGRPPHARRPPQLGRAGGVRRRRRGDRRRRRPRAHARRRGRPTAAARPISRPRWRGSCSAGSSLDDALAVAAQRLAAAIGASSAAIELGVRRRRRAPRGVSAAPRGRRADRHARAARRRSPRDDRERIARADRAGARSRCSRRRCSRAELEARGRRDGGAAPQRRDEDGAAALGLARPAHAADGDHQRGRVARPGAPRRRAGRPRCARSCSRRRRASRRWSRSCSTSRGCSRAPARSSSAAYSLEEVLAEAIEHVDGRPRAAAALARRRPAAARTATPASSSARSRT